MVSSQARSVYGHLNSQTKIHPVKLIHMLFERVLMHLEYAEEGIKENSPSKRGENLGKAVAIISELNSSVSQDDDSEAAHFLRSLYEAILIELPKVSVNNDLGILKRTHEYMARLKETWEMTAMQENGLECGHKHIDEETPKIVCTDDVISSDQPSKNLSFSI